MLLLKVVGMLLKYELNELAITSGSLIMLPFSLMKVIGDFGCYQEWYWQCKAIVLLL